MRIHLKRGRFVHHHRHKHTGGAIHHIHNIKDLTTEIKHLVIKAHKPKARKKVMI